MEWKEVRLFATRITIENHVIYDLDNNLRKDALETAHRLFNAKNRESFVEIKKMMEDGEPPLFQDKFADWPDSFSKLMGRSGGLDTRLTSFNP